MADKNTQNSETGQAISDVLKSWMMVTLTLIFVLLYVIALFGWLKTPVDVAMISRLEPIIFIIIGYYFGRLPAQQNEKTLKEEITRQTQKAEASQHAKEQAKQEQEILEEKIKNAKTVLNTNSISMLNNITPENGTDVEALAAKRESLQHSVETAVKILGS